MQLARGRLPTRSPWRRCHQARLLGLIGRTFTSSTFRSFPVVDAQPALDLSKTRNIGIIAHIDAGKTTTTERMLYYSGYTKRIGNVDEGSTITDFLPAERERGVTIQSAAISFNWPPLPANSASSSSRTTDLETHNINLIDTPGHADFTFEVIRSLRILDGAVCILDGVAGVQAQTEKVWYQAAKYDIPKLVFVNKLDRDEASFGKCVRQIATRLRTYPAVCQIPWRERGKGRFCGIGDAVALRAIRWEKGGDGTEFKIYSSDQLEKLDKDFYAELRKARRALVELLTEHEEQMLDKYADAGEDPFKIDSKDIVKSLRASLINLKSNIVPIFAGSSLRNAGVQTLLDAVVQYLPDPTEAPDPEISVGELDGKLSNFLSGQLLDVRSSHISDKSVTKSKKPNLSLIQNLESCALAFKVVHDPFHGALVYVRVYSGSIKRNTVLFNTNLQLSERPSQLWKMYASEPSRIDSIPAGQIGVIPGLKRARTGDTLISYAGLSLKSNPPPPLNALQLRPIAVPPAMYSSSVEPKSLSDQKPTRAILDLLTREDPSLQVTEDEDSGQTVLSGMGVFHLEIANDRLIKHYKAKASTGKIEIAYRETILRPSNQETYTFESSSRGKASCTALVEPLDNESIAAADLQHAYTTLEEGNRITIIFQSISSDGTKVQKSKMGAIPAHLDIDLIHSSLKNGAFAALGSSITYGFQFSNIHVTIALDPEKHIYGTDTTPSALSAAARYATKNALRKTTEQHGSAILEPIMDVTITIDGPSLGAVIKDVSSSRGGHVLSTDEESDLPDDRQASSTEAPRSGPVIDKDSVYAPPDPYESSDSLRVEDVPDAGTGQRIIKAKVPLKEMNGYSGHLGSLTGGRGSFVMSPDRFEKVSRQRERNILHELGRI